jgi:hypothetical protein
MITTPRFPTMATTIIICRSPLTMETTFPIFFICIQTWVNFDDLVLLVKIGLLSSMFTRSSFLWGFILMAVLIIFLIFIISVRVRYTMRLIQKLVLPWSFLSIRCLSSTWKVYWNNSRFTTYMFLIYVAHLIWSSWSLQGFTSKTSSNQLFLMHFKVSKQSSGFLFVLILLLTTFTLCYM